MNKKLLLSILLGLLSFFTFSQTPIKVALISNSTVTGSQGWGGRFPSKFQSHVTIHNADGARAIAPVENVHFIGLFYLSVTHHNEIGEATIMA